MNGTLLLSMGEGLPFREGAPDGQIITWNTIHSISIRRQELNDSYNDVVEIALQIVLLMGVTGKSSRNLWY